MAETRAVLARELDELKGRLLGIILPESSDGDTAVAKSNKLTGTGDGGKSTRRVGGAKSTASGKKVDSGTKPVHATARTTTSKSKSGPSKDKKGADRRKSSTVSKIVAEAKELATDVLTAAAAGAAVGAAAAVAAHATEGMEEARKVMPTSQEPKKARSGAAKAAGSTTRSSSRS